MVEFFCKIIYTDQNSDLNIISKDLIKILNLKKIFLEKGLIIDTACGGSFTLSKFVKLEIEVGLIWQTIFAVVRL